jgi:hypothetical protein
MNSIVNEGFIVRVVKAYGGMNVLMLYMTFNIARNNAP